MANRSHPVESACSPATRDLCRRLDEATPPNQRQALDIPDDGCVSSSSPAAHPTRRSFSRPSSLTTLSPRWLHRTEDKSRAHSSSPGDYAQKARAGEAEYCRCRHPLSRAGIASARAARRLRTPFSTWLSPKAIAATRRRVDLRPLFSAEAKSASRAFVSAANQPGIPPTEVATGILALMPSADARRDARIDERATSSYRRSVMPPLEPRAYLLGALRLVYQAMRRRPVTLLLAAPSGAVHGRSKRRMTPTGRRSSALRSPRADPAVGDRDAAPRGSAARWSERPCRALCAIVTSSRKTARSTTTILMHGRSRRLLAPHGALAHARRATYVRSIVLATYISERRFLERRLRYHASKTNVILKGVSLSFDVGRRI